MPCSGSERPPGATSIFSLKRHSGQRRLECTRYEPSALKHRIGREDRELYDLIDRAVLASAA